MKTDYIFDFIIMLAKQYIYKCKTEQSLPNLPVFQKYLSNRYKIEQFNAKIGNNVQKFDMQWSLYKPVFDYTE